MEWLNYHHLLYFYTVAREGGVVAAASRMNVTQPTITAQVRALEESLGEKLFRKQGRRLVLTDVGHVVYRYADEIFALGRELRDTVKGRPTGRPSRFVVGIADVVPKTIAYRLIEPAFALPEKPVVTAREDSPDQLFAQLALHELDLVISDAPVPPGSALRAFNHLLGDSGLTFFGTKGLAAKHREGFPRSLEAAPVLLPAHGSELRRLLAQWLDANDLRPTLVAEFEDSALMKMFGHLGHGIFPAPTAIENEVCRQYGVEIIGRAPEVRERFYAISPERKIKHPAVVTITDRAKALLSRN
jgi:LysR family transcriptional activator of nhaA